MTTDRRRLAIFTGRWVSASTIETILAIADHFPTWQILVVQSVGRPPLRRYIRNKIRSCLKEPISCPLGILSRLIARLRPCRGRVIGREMQLPELDALGVTNVEFLRCNSIHAKSTLRAVAAFGPWLGLSIGAPILKPRLFSIPERGTINIHKSFLPNYRGMPPGFWELYDGAESSGVTVHWMEAGLDTGDIVLQEALPIAPFATVGGLQAELDALGIDVLIRALEQIASGSDKRSPQGEPSGATNSKPSWLDERRVRRRLARNRGPRSSAIAAFRQFAKRLVLLCYVHLWAPLRNFVNGLRGRCHATILLYHRVSDEYLDTLTVGVEQFSSQLDILRRHYDVSDMPSFLAARGRRRKRPTVLITFDDGYKNNYLAATLLRRAGLPATFFLSTRIVGTDTNFPHDIESEDAPIPALNWDEVREMAKWGYQFGIHTAHHVNVARVPLETASAEIEAAIADLSDELGQTSWGRWLAYPYGQSDDITDEVHSALPELGVEYCLSAYGGVNLIDFPALDIKRQGIHHSFDSLALRAAIEGWRVR